MHAVLDYETCCETSSHAQRHGTGKGPMTAHGAPVKKYGMGKGFITGAPRNKHGIGKGLMMFQRGAKFDGRDCQNNAYSTGGIIQKKKKRAQPRESLLVCSPILFYMYLVISLHLLLY